MRSPARGPGMGAVMKRRVGTLIAGTLIAASLVVGLDVGGGAGAAGGATRQIPSGGTTTIRSTAQGPDAVQQPEFRATGERGGRRGSFNRPRPGFKNGKFPKKPLDAPTVASSSAWPR